MSLLKPGDVLDIIAPSARCESDVFEKLMTFLKGWELHARIPEKIFNDHPLSSNTESKRLNDLLHALYNSESKAIWCLRGGYGAMKLIPHLVKQKPPVQPKIFIGFSDITALHIFLQQQWGWTTIHGPSAYQVANNKVSLDSINKLHQLLFSKSSLSYSQLTPLNKAAKKNQKICAEIVGGNLTLVQSSLGTPWQINCDNKILFLEEVNERGYRVDRMLEQLKQAGIFKKVQTILLGDFIGGVEPNGEFLLDWVKDDFARHIQCPVLTVSGIGHNQQNDPLVLGEAVQLTLNDTPLLTMRTML